MYVLFIHSSIARSGSGQVVFILSFLERAKLFRDFIICCTKTLLYLKNVFANDISWCWPNIALYMLLNIFVCYQIKQKFILYIKVITIKIFFWNLQQPTQSWYRYVYLHHFAIKRNIEKYFFKTVNIWWLDLVKKVKLSIVNCCNNDICFSKGPILFRKNVNMVIFLI